MKEVDANAKLVSLIGAATRTAKSSEGFLAALLKTLIDTLSAKAGAVYLADHSSVIMLGRNEAVGFCTAPGFTLCAWLGISAPTARRVQLPADTPLDTDESWRIFEAKVSRISVANARVFPMKASDKLRGAVIIYDSDPNLVPDTIVAAALSDAGTMLDMVTDRFLQRDLVELNQLSLSIASADPPHFMSILLAEAIKRLGCEGISFFARDPTEEVATFRLVGTAPLSMPEDPTCYSIDDSSVTSYVLHSRTLCLVHYDRLQRKEIASLGPPRWRDVPADIETDSVVFAPVVKNDQLVALLRCTNKCLPNQTSHFNSIDLRRADAFAALLMTWHIAAETEHRFASSLMDISHEIKTGAAGIRSAANFVKRELAKHPSVNTAENLARKLDHIATAAESLIRILPALGRANSPATISLRPRTAFRPYADLCRPICDLFRGQAIARQLRFEFVGADQLGLLYADIEDFRLVFQNLVSNAVKYTLPSKEIFVKLQRADTDYASIHVLSESLPVRPDEREAIFRFRSRGKSAHASGTEGDGMGLAIARAKARALNGDLTFRTTSCWNIFSFLISSKLFRPPKESPI
jgi:signal transduction histidine kinase